MWKHGKTGGWYWRISSLLVPAEMRGKGPYTNVPLVPTGRDHATKTRPLAESCQARLWRQWQAAGAGQAVTPIAKWLAEFADWNTHHASSKPGPARAIQDTRRYGDLSDETVLAFLSFLRAHLDRVPSCWKRFKPVTWAERPLTERLWVD